MKRVVKWRGELYHSNDLETLTVIDDVDWALVQEPIKDLYVGSADIDPEDIELITDDPTDVAVMERLLGEDFHIGFDLFGYIRDRE